MLKQRLLSFASSVLHVLLTVFLGYALSFKPISHPFVFLFAVASKLYAIVFEEDIEASKKVRIYQITVLILSILFITKLSLLSELTGILILILYTVYPFLKAKAPFDLLHHILRYVLLFILGYDGINFNNQMAQLALSAVVFSAVMGELLEGLRGDKINKKSTASLLGIRKSLIVVIFLAFAVSFAFSYILNYLFEFPVQISNIFIPFYMMLAPIPTLFLMKPLIETGKGKKTDTHFLIKKVEIAAIIMTLLLILVVLHTGRVETDIIVGSRNYNFDVEIKTIIAGTNTWEVPWILFDYVDQDNYYYVLLHKNGMLELSQVIDGQRETYIASIKTPSTAFQWHNFRINPNNTTITVALDGKYQLTAPRNSTGTVFRIKISSSIPGHFWLANIAKMNWMPE